MTDNTKDEIERLKIENRCLEQSGENIFKEAMKAVERVRELEAENKRLWNTLRIINKMYPEEVALVREGMEKLLSSKSV